MMANLAVFPKWHSSGTDNARATLTHIDGAEEQWLNLSDTNPVHTHSSLNTLASQAQGRTLERGSKQQLYTHSHSHRLTSYPRDLCQAIAECRMQQMEPGTQWGSRSAAFGLAHPIHQRDAYPSDHQHPCVIHASYQ